ncbi:MAG: RelA/SpoT domain-containing protein [Halothiobacillaceae bacterium]|nr:RelA/SpoT domain-containing protein [Halothiobacillaceae bacterium]
MDNHPYRHLAELIRREVEDILDRVGILCRVFGRGKTTSSLEQKVHKEEGKYSSGGKLIQDTIGIRVVLYFSEDIDIVQHLLQSKFNINKSASTIDNHEADQFAVTRHNLIFEIPSIYKEDMRRVIGDKPYDTTFELQLRSVLSEGWHEVDHDLRYKSKSHWEGQYDLGRALNGILATIETAEWSMRKIFDDLAYNNYKKQNWIAMIHSKVRMRAEPSLNQAIIDLMNQDNEFSKEILRINRKKLIECFANTSPHLPITLNNIVYIWNLLGPKNPKAIELTPPLVQDAIAHLLNK